MSTTYGYGTIYQRSSDGRWMASVDLPRQRGEKRRRRVFSGSSREAVAAQLTAYREELPATPHLGREANYEQARAQGTHTRREWFALVRASQSLCLYCGTRTSVLTCQKDHKLPVSRGGSDGIDNIAVSCRACNGEKGTMTADEYVAWKARR